ncbi:very low-density lipoprotein receptor-like [Mytilus californianus]|uniref:very low-density lipoprotein receptor-like n=1 Tax=Mytilus californianus TaxID=6549 RepID=UPI0022460BF2|nr:very low-density lipoprotein receptor-like [Mytilus californianus]
MWRKFSLMCIVLIGLHVAKVNTCETGELECDRLEQCYPKELKCDGNADCRDGTDECGCDEYICPDNRLKCPDDLCGMKDGKLCDGHSDCPSNKDEEDCDSCIDDAFLCSKEEKCIPGDWHCDGYDDCNGEDEKDCIECNGGAFMCTADSKCVRSRYVCDSFPDCSDGMYDIGCPDDGCGNDEFACALPPPNYPNCVPSNKIYDDTNDCGDCSDEANAESCVLGGPPPPGELSRSLLKTRGERKKKNEGRVNTVVRSNKNIDALRSGKSYLKENLREYLLRSKTGNRLANRILGRREMEKRRRYKR